MQLGLQKIKQQSYFFLLQQSSAVVPKKLTWEGVSTPWNFELRLLSVLLSPKYSRLSCFQAEISVGLFAHARNFRKKIYRDSAKIKVPVHSQTGRCQWARCTPWCLCVLQKNRRGCVFPGRSTEKITSLVMSNRHNHLCLLCSEWRWCFGGQRTSTPWRSPWISAYPWNSYRRNRFTVKASAKMLSEDSWFSLQRRDVVVVDEDPFNSVVEVLRVITFLTFK